jgi:hypothetical protein
VTTVRTHGKRVERLQPNCDLFLEYSERARNLRGLAWLAPVRKVSVRLSVYASAIEQQENFPLAQVKVVPSGSRLPDRNEQQGAARTELSLDRAP